METLTSQFNSQDYDNEISRLQQQVAALQQERLELSAALEQTQRVFRQGFDLTKKIFDSMPGLLLVVDEAGICITSNPALDYLLGVPVGSLKNRSVAELFFGGDEFQQCLIALNQRKALRDYVLTLKPANATKTPFDVIFNINPLHDWSQPLDGGSSLVAYVFTGQLASEAHYSNIVTAETNRRLALLNLVSDRIRSTLDLNEVLQTIVSELGKLLGLDYCLLVEAENVLTEELNQGRVMYQYTDSDLDVATGQRLLGFSHPAIEESLKTGQAVIIDDTLQLNNSSLAASPARSILILPITFGKKCQALLALVYIDLHSWTAPEIELAQEVAERAAGAITNARLFAEVVAERKYNAAILNSMGEGVITIDSEGRIRSLNPAAASLLQLDAAQATGEIADNILPFELAAKINQQTTHRYLHAKRIVEVTTTALVDEAANSIGTVSLLRDLTELARIENMKDEFITLASHEMRTPLTSLTGALDLLAEADLGPLNEVQQEFLQLARTNNQRLNHLLNAIIDITTIQSGRAKLDVGPLRLSEAIDRAIEGGLEQSLNAKDIRLRLNIASGCNLVRGDAGRVIQIFENLLSNACKFTPKGGFVEISAEPSSAWEVRITVSDSGIGISEQERRHLFEKFYRVDNSLTREEGGSGLGLLITKSLIELHGGQLEVVSVPGLGSNFSFTLPRYESA